MSLERVIDEHPGVIGRVRSWSFGALAHWNDVTKKTYKTLSLPGMLDACPKKRVLLPRIPPKLGAANSISWTLTAYQSATYREQAGPTRSFYQRTNDRACRRLRHWPPEERRSFTGAKTQFARSGLQEWW